MQQSHSYLQLIIVEKSNICFYLLPPLPKSAVLVRLTASARYRAARMTYGMAVSD